MTYSRRSFLEKKLNWPTVRLEESIPSKMSHTMLRKRRTNVAKGLTRHAPKRLWEDCENNQDAELMQHYLYLCYHCIVHINSFRHVCQSHVKFSGKVARRPCCDNEEVILDMLPVLQGDLLCVHFNSCDCPLLETFSECWFVRDEDLCCITCKSNGINESRLAVEGPMPLGEKPKSGKLLPSTPK